MHISNFIVSMGNKKVEAVHGKNRLFILCKTYKKVFLPTRNLYNRNQHT